MAENDGNPSSTVPGSVGTAPAAGRENAAAATAGMSLEDINTLTGRNYKTLDEARTGVSETYKFVGAKPKEVIVEKEKIVIPEGYVSEDKFHSELFYRDNPDYAKNRTLIDSLAKANGVTPQKVVETDFYKETAGKLKTADTAENTRSVLTSNPRLGIIRDSSQKAQEHMSEAAKASHAGDPVGTRQHIAAAESEALKGVINAYGMEKDRIV